MAHSKSILWATALCMGVSTASVCAQAADAGHAVMLSPIIVTPDDAAPSAVSQDNAIGTRVMTGRSSSKGIVRGTGTDDNAVSGPGADSQPAQQDK